MNFTKFQNCPLVRKNVKHYFALITLLLIFPRCFNGLKNSINREIKFSARWRTRWRVSQCPRGVNPHSVISNSLRSTDRVKLANLVTISTTRKRKKKEKNKNVGGSSERMFRANATGFKVRSFPKSR